MTLLLTAIGVVMNGVPVPREPLMRSTTLRAMLVFVTLAPLVLVTVFATKAMACPFCNGGPSGVNEVREGIFDGSFWPRVAATLAPFPVFAGIVALIYFGPPSFKRRRSDAATSASPTSSWAD